MHFYFNKNPGVVPMADLLVEDAEVLVVDVNFIQPLSAVHEVIFGDVKG